MSGEATLVDNPAWAQARPVLSILIPFMRDDPTPLLRALGRETAEVEVIALDDGTGDPALAARVAAEIEALPLPARFIRLDVNQGRAKGRNRLVGHARAATLLFLDSDMLPDRPDFLGRWLALLRSQAPAVAFGGFSLDQTPRLPQTAVHRSMALKSDCLPASERALAPEKNVFTSNLMVRRDVFDAVSFDESFTGWGWEDVEWAMRVSQRWPIVHIDNPATHLGLDAAPVLARKYEQAAANFARVVASHPQIVAGYPSYRVARMLKRVPLPGLWRPVVKAVALSSVPPVALRAFAMRLHRAGCYSEVL